MTGNTLSPDFPTTPGAVRRILSGRDDAFVARLDPAASSPIFSTYLGGAESDTPAGIALDLTGNVVLAGSTGSRNFPTAATALQPTLAGPGDLFVAKLDPTGAALLSSSYLGGRGAEFAAGLAVDPQGAVFLAATTNSPDFPVSPDAFQSTFRQGNARLCNCDAVVARISDGAPAVGQALNVSAATLHGPVLAPDSAASAFGAGLAPGTEFRHCAGGLVTELGGVSVNITDSAGAEHAAPVFYVSPEQVNFFVPPEVAHGRARVSIVRPDAGASSGPVEIETAAPGLYTANENGIGTVAATVCRLGPVGPTSCETVFDWLAPVGSRGPRPIDLGPEGEQKVLLLYGTGIRNAGTLAARIGGVSVEASLLVKGICGFDAVEVRLPRSLAGRGDVDLVLLADGKPSNTVWLRFQDGSRS